MGSRGTRLLYQAKEDVAVMPHTPTPRFPGAGAVPAGILTWFLLCEPVLSGAAVLTLGQSVNKAPLRPVWGLLTFFVPWIPSQNIFLCIK